MWINKKNNLTLNELRFLFACLSYALLLLLAGYFSVNYFAHMAPNPTAWDTGWYKTIALHGYSFAKNSLGQQNFAFFPLYPIALSIIQHILNSRMIYSIIVTSSLFTFGSMFFLYKNISAFYDKKLAKIVLLLFFTYPFAIYLFNGYSEAAWIFSILAFVYFLEVKKNYFMSILFINLASLARPYGILIGTAMFCYLLKEIYINYRANKELFVTSRELNFLLCWLPLSFLSLQLFTSYLWLKFDDPLIFWHALEGWAKYRSYRPHFPGRVFYKTFTDSLTSIHKFSDLARPILWAILYFYICLSAIVLKIFRSLLKRDNFNTLDTVGIILLIYFIYIKFNSNSLINLGRHLLPVYLTSVIILANFFRGEPHSSPIVDNLKKLFFVVVIFFQSYLFTIFSFRFYTVQWVS